MYYPPGYLRHFLLQTSIFVYNFCSGVNFCGEKICGNFILWELIFADREKTAKIAKIYCHKVCSDAMHPLRYITHDTFDLKFTTTTTTTLYLEGRNQKLNELTCK